MSASGILTSVCIDLCSTTLFLRQSKDALPRKDAPRAKGAVGNARRSPLALASEIMTLLPHHPLSGGAHLRVTRARLKRPSSLRWSQSAAWEKQWALAPRDRERRRATESPTTTTNLMTKGRDIVVVDLALLSGVLTRLRLCRTQVTARDRTGVQVGAQSGHIPARGLGLGPGPTIGETTSVLLGLAEGYRRALSLSDAAFGLFAFREIVTSPTFSLLVTLARRTPGSRPKRLLVLETCVFGSWKAELLNELANGPSTDLGTRITKPADGATRLSSSTRRGLRHRRDSWPWACAPGATDLRPASHQHLLPLTRAINVASRCRTAPWILRYQSTASRSLHP